MSPDDGGNPLSVVLDDDFSGTRAMKTHLLADEFHVRPSGCIGKPS